MNSLEKELTVLECVLNSPDQINQRSLAREAGLSLGMTNAVLKRLAAKGLITIKKVNNRNIFYAASPRGMELIARKSYNYLKRTIRDMAGYREVLESLVKEVAARGYSTILLLGSSELDFIVEHFCRKYNLRFTRDGEIQTDEIFTIYSERYIPDDENRRPDSAFMQDVLMQGGEVRI